MNTVIFLTSGYPWPEYMMPKGFSLVVKSIWPFIYLAGPLKSLNLKGLGWDMILPSIQGEFYFALFWLPVGIILYSTKIFRQKRLVESKHDPIIPARIEADG